MNHRIRLLICMTAFLSQISLPCAHAEKPTKVEIVKLGKQATALVEVKNRGTGSAFCVHPSGLFITNQHVIGNSENPEINLILNPSLKDQRILKAKVVRVNKDLDLALLRAEEPGVLVSLALGSVDDVVELLDVIAFGFPFGNALADQKEFPAVSVNAGSVTALRRKGAELNRIQLDVALNPGNSGGAVVDDKGKVIGVVVSGITGGARINYAIPVSHLAKFLNAPDFRVTPIEIMRSSAQGPVQFKVEVVSFVPNAPEPDVRIELRAGDEESRVLEMKKQDGKFTATAIPIRKGAGERVEVNIRFDSGSVTGMTKDVKFKVGKNELHLSEVSKITFKPKPLVVLADGRTTQQGEVSGLSHLDVVVGGAVFKADLAKVTQILIQAAPEIVELNATIIASINKLEIGRFDAVIPIRDATRTSTAADPSSVTIIPPKLVEERVVKKLPATFSDVVAAGGGRYLIFHLPKLRKLAIFDVNEARVTGYIPLTDDKIVFAGGLEKIVVGLPSKGLLERWSLATLEREISVETTIEMRSLFMGHASNGPVVLSGQFLDLGNFRPLPQKAGIKGNLVAIAADGTAIAEWYPDSQAGGKSSVFVVEGEEVKHYPTGEWGHIIPGPDGKTMFTARGLANSQLNQSSDQAKFGYCLPAMRGNLFLSLGASSRDNDMKVSGYTVYAVGQPAPIVKVPNAELGLTMNGRDPLLWGAWRRCYFIPQANVIVVLPETNDQIVLHKIDIDDALDKSGVDYLLITSQPPQTVRKGTALSYRIAVKAKNKEITYRLDAGPKGMEVSKEGVVSWKVPADATEGDQEVILTIRDSKRQEIFHTFTLRLLK